MFDNSLYNLLYLGVVNDIDMNSTNQLRDTDTKLIDKIEECQINGDLNLIPNSKESRISLSISQHGIKIVNENGVVLNREALHSVAQVLVYCDALNKCNMAIKIGSVGRSIYSCHVLQCNDQKQADEISNYIKQVYNTVMNRRSL